MKLFQFTSSASNGNGYIKKIMFLYRLLHKLLVYQLTLCQYNYHGLSFHLNYQNFKSEAISSLVNLLILQEYDLVKHCNTTGTEAKLKDKYL